MAICWVVGEIVGSKSTSNWQIKLLNVLTQKQPVVTDQRDPCIANVLINWLKTDILIFGISNDYLVALRFLGIWQRNVEEFEK